jgi:hypothetical protein
MKRALVLSLVLAVGLGFAGFAQTLAGSWDTSICIDLTESDWKDVLEVSSEIVIDYTVGDWTFSTETDVLDGVWFNQDFDFSGVLGAFAISGALEFYPNGPYPYTGTPQFQFFKVVSSVSIAGVTFGVDFRIFPDDVWLALSGSGVAGDVTISVTIGFGDPVHWGSAYKSTDLCDLDFYDLEIDVDFPFCCADISAELYFTCGGFQYVEFCFDGLTIENLPWLTLGGCVTFQTDSKTFAFYPELDLGLIGCDFDLYMRLATDPLIDTYDYIYGTSPLTGGFLFDGFWFDGIQISCEIGGVSFTGISYWGPGFWKYGWNGYKYYYPGILYGMETWVAGALDNQFYEAYQIATTDDGCCGPFSFDVTVFFREDADSLFDVAWFTANMEIQVASQFTFGLGLDTDVENNTVDEICFTFLVEW